MFSAVRSIVSRRAAVAVARPAFKATVAPFRAFTQVTARFASAQDVEDGIPEGLNLRVDENGIRWADYRPDNVRAISATRNEDGILEGKFGGEDVVFPDMEPTLEWVLSTPVDAHLFEESPIIKMYEEESGVKWN